MTKRRRHDTDADITRALDALRGYVVLEHDGHQAIIHFDMADRIFVGRIVAMNDDIGFHVPPGGD